VTSLQDASGMKAKLHFTKIDCLATKLAKKLPVDVVAVVTNVGPLGSVKRQSDGSEFVRRCAFHAEQVLPCRVHAARS
jgi:hypothetical protein